MCREIEGDDAVLILDDSVDAKPDSKCNILIRYHFNHPGCKSVKGVNFITAVYKSWEMSLPVGVDFVVKGQAYIDKGGKTKYKSKGAQLPFRYVLKDSWFTNAENMAFIN